MMKSHAVNLAMYRHSVLRLVLIVIVLPGICVSFQPLHQTYITKTRLVTRLGAQHNENESTLQTNEFKSLVDRMSCLVATMTAASVVLFSSSTAMMAPALPAFADTTDTDFTIVATTTSEKEQESMLLKGVSQKEIARRAAEQRNGDFSSSVIDEVWTLLSNYYIDQSFNSQDWNKVREKVESKGVKVNFNDNKSMKIVTEMVQSLGDKYTRVLDKDQYAAIQKFDLIGVGVTLMPNSQKDIIIGAPPIAGSASDKAGLKMGDYVTAVNGIPTRGRNAFDIIDQIGENPNAKQVSFSILRDKGPSTIDSIGNPQSADNFVVTLERQTMEVKDPVQFKISETRSDGTKVGYVRVSEFNSLVNSSLQHALSELNKEGANAYVMDLRGNTGGAFQSAIEISGLFLRDRVATYVVDSNQVELPFRTPKLQDLSIDPETPMVVWIDGLSASASEVLAGSLHDNCRAVTMGDKSFGKGLIQAVYGLKNGAGLVVTVAKYITPSGSEIQGLGITPDVLPLGKNMPAPVYVPVLSTDTSKIDWRDVRERLSSKFCSVPEDRVPAKTPTGAVAEAAL